MNQIEDIQRRVFIAGAVQGVSFRAATLQEVQKYSDIRGFIRNLEDGRVEAVFLGPQSDILKLLKWCLNGPSLAKVESMEVKEESMDTRLTKFKILS